MTKGLIHVYTGDGKGKTTAALGLCLRASGQGFSVAFYQFLKTGETGEARPAKTLGWDFRQFATGRWFIDEPPDERERQLAQEGIRATLDAFQERNIVVLDEFSHALNLGLLSENDFLRLIEGKPGHVELVLTGRDMPPCVTERADLVTEVKMIKHPFEKGISARQGIEY